MSMTVFSEHEDGWLQVKVPLPYSLKWVNAYLIPEDEGWTLIDPGMHTPEAVALWEKMLPGKGIGWERIHRIVVTHHHPDHYGLAGWFQQRTGASVWMSGTARLTAERTWGEGDSYTGPLLHAFRAHGFPPDLANAIEGDLRGFGARVSPGPINVNPLAAGTDFPMGGREWQMIEGEGHAPGHLSFFDPKGRVLICGDQVLPHISPNIGWEPNGDPNPLGSYLDSLASMRSIDAVIAYPGHRDPFEGYGERVGALLEHHERRLDKMFEILALSKLTSFELCEILFGTHLRGNTHNLRFALAETIAHLILLERRGLVTREGGNGEEIRYRKA